jgi:N-acetylneuraminic acid mutarotase
VDGKIYALGGSNYSASFVFEPGTNINEEYDPTLNAWTEKSPMPTARSQFATAVYQNRIYCIGGHTDNNFHVVGANEVYDPSTDSWTTKTAMPTPKQALSANVVGDKIYLIGGSGPVSSLTGFFYTSNLTQVYDIPSDTWSAKSSIPEPVYDYASAVVGDKIYIMGSVGTTWSTRNQIYHPATDTWSTGAPSPSIPGDAAGLITDSEGNKHIYVLGTRADNGSSVAVYDPKSDAWAAVAPMPTARCLLGVGVVNGTLYAIGGARFTGSASKTILAQNEAYSPSEDVSPLPSQSPSSTVSPSSSLNPTPSIPEFPTWIILPVVAVATLLAVITVRKRRKS